MYGDVCVSSQPPLSMKEQARLIAEANGFDYYDNVLYCKKYRYIIYIGNLNQRAIFRFRYLYNSSFIFYALAEGDILIRLDKRINNIKYVVTPSNFAKEKFEKAGIKVDYVIPHGIEIPKSVKPINEKKGYFYRAYYQKRKFPDYGISFLKMVQDKYDIDIYLTGMPLDKRFLAVSKIKAVIDGVIDRDKINDMYNSHKFYLNLSDNEGFGLTPLEAMSFGEVIITPEYPTIMEYLPVDCNLTVKVYDAWNEYIHYEYIQHYIYKPEEYYNTFLKSLSLTDAELERMSKCNMEVAKGFDYRKVYKRFYELIY